ncbi:hypothetical protein [Nocardia inohanensis]|uniref:hypothetical protein n=1 Tax=Nocardia inohanensis TaxID=209246 RepID=UPI000A445A21|nr:hypothetical protein [Nocardia inohanensis]
MTHDPADPLTELRAGLDLLRFSVDAANSTMKGILQEMRAFDARLRALEAKTGDLPDRT